MDDDGSKHYVQVIVDEKSRYAATYDFPAHLKSSNRVIANINHFNTTEAKPNNITIKHVHSDYESIFNSISFSLILFEVHG